MRRSFFTAVVLGLVALLGSACNIQWGTYAAKVGPKVVSQSQLNDSLASLKGASGFLCLFGLKSVQGAGTDTYSPRLAQFVLTGLVNASIASQFVASRHLAVPASARSVATDQLTASISSQLSQRSCTGATGRAALSELGPSLSAAEVTFELDQDALAARAAGISLRPASISGYEASHHASTDERCISIIEVKTRAAANSVARTLRRNKLSFSEAAAKYSLDPQSKQAGGAVGCLDQSQVAALGAPLGPAVMALHAGVVSEPVQYSGAYLLLLVTSEPPEPSAAVVDQLISSEASKWVPEMQRAMRDASVQVNPQYGYWRVPKASPTSSGFGQVFPFTGTAAKFSLNEKAISATS